MQRFYEIASSGQRMDVPLNPDNLMRLAEICQVDAGTRVLDLACGKGELLVQWARRYDLQGTGVDDDERLIDAAQLRANELEVWSQVHFVTADIMAYPQAFHQYHIVSLLTATGMSTGLTETIDIMRQALKDKAGGLLLIGAMFWQKTPTPEVCKVLEVEPDWLGSIGELSHHFSQAGVDLLDMLIATAQERDAYCSQQWRACVNWLRDNPTHEDVPALREWLNRSRSNYLTCEREYLGWGIFVLNVPGQPARSSPHKPDEDDDLRFEWQSDG